MRYSKSLAVLVVAAGVAACGWRRNPVPVISETGSIQALVGTWSGQHNSAETGRSGSIMFELASDKDNDPDCGCKVITTFAGRFTDSNTIEGTYSTQGTGIGHQPSAGQWKVTRQSSTTTDTPR